MRKKKVGTVVTRVIFGALHGALDELEKSIVEGEEKNEDEVAATPLTVVKDEEEAEKETE